MSRARTSPSFLTGRLLTLLSLALAPGAALATTVASTLNASGGTSSTDGLAIDVIDTGAIQVTREGQIRIFGDFADP